MSGAEAYYITRRHRKQTKRCINSFSADADKSRHERPSAEVD